MQYTDVDGKDHLLTSRASVATIASWCEVCVRHDGTVDPQNLFTIVDANVDAIDAFDIVTLIFAASIIAFQVVGELKDVELCSIAIKHAGDKLSKGWRIALGVLLWMRRWIFLPSLVGAIPALVMIKGGDALSVCFNTVAILFLCDIDNIAFNVGLGERVRARVEAVGRVELQDVEATALTRTKVVHVILVVLVVSCSVWTKVFILAFYTSFLAFVIGGVAESFVQGAGGKETLKRVATTIAASVAGVFAQGFLMNEMYRL